MSKILLVDEDSFSRNVFAKALKKEGFEVFHADTRHSAEEILDANSVDVIAVDGSTESDGGLKFVQALRERGFHQPLVLLQSVFRDESPPLQLDALEVTAVLTKPLSPSELIAQIQRLVQDREPSAKDTLELIRGSVNDFAATVDREIFALENSLRTQRETNGDHEKVIFETVRLVELTRQHGFVRLSQALGRVEQALIKIESRRGRMNRQLWAELNDALDDAYVAARRHVMEHRKESPQRDTTKQRECRVLLLDEDSDVAPQLEAYGNKHLFEIFTVHTAVELFEAMATLNVDVVFVDIDSDRDGTQAFETLKVLRNRTDNDIPIAVISDATDAKSRIEAAQIGAVRFLHKPIDGTEFADAVQFMRSQRLEINPHVMVIQPDAKPDAFHKALQDAGFILDHVSDVGRVLDELERCEAGAALIYPGADKANPTEIVRMLRASPRWGELSLFYAPNADSQDTAAVIRAGADDAFPATISGDEVVARMSSRMRRIQTLTERADRDVLTGLLMRRAFLERVSIRLSEARRQGRTLAVCILDLDRFKRVNDSYGHLAGDRVLIELGRVLREQFRLEDVRCRWGGEEFAVALINEGATTAQRAMQRALDRFAETPFKDQQGNIFHCTFSAGIAEFPSDGERFEELLRKADERLFESKVAGRNRITK